MLLNKTMMEFPRQFMEVVRERIPREFPADSIRKIPDLSVRLATPDVPPRDEESFFNGHYSVEISDKPPIRNARDEGKLGTFPPPYFFEALLGDRFQRTHIDDRFTGARPHDIASLGYHNKTSGIDLKEVRPFVAQLFSLGGIGLVRVELVDERMRSNNAVTLAPSL
jgi:hypothetical protein